MFSLVSTAVLALAATATAAPSRYPRSAPVAVISSGSSSSLNPSLSSFSLNNWGGFDCLSDFDSFFGQNNFCGSLNSQTVLTQTVTCETQSIDLIQQQLAILTEYAKRVILTDICQVEVQTIVWSQFVAQIQSFSTDLTRVSGRSIGYDSHIASFINQVVTSSDEINLEDFGFSGSDIGSQLIVPSGNNWISGSSQFSVQQSLVAAQVAQIQSSSSLISSSSIGSSGGLGVSSGTFDVSSL